MDNMACRVRVGSFQTGFGCYIGWYQSYKFRLVGEVTTEPELVKFVLSCKLARKWQGEYARIRQGKLKIEVLCVLLCDWLWGKFGNIIAYG